MSSPSLSKGASEKPTRSDVEQIEHAPHAIAVEVDGDGNPLPPPPELSPEQERALWRKIDLRLMPMLSVMYLMSFLDRGGRFVVARDPHSDLTCVTIRQYRECEAAGAHDATRVSWKSVQHCAGTSAFVFISFEVADVSPSTSCQTMYFIVCSVFYQAASVC